MEAFNKNWLVILLTALIFGSIGFLMGRSTSHHHGREVGKQRIMKFKSDKGEDFDFKIDGNEENVKVEVTIDTVMENGKKLIKKEIRKTIKE